MLDQILDIGQDVIDDVDFVLTQLSDAQILSTALPVSVWAGFSNLASPSGRELLTELFDAGARRIVFTPTNDASSSVWRWQPSRARLAKSIEAAKGLGFAVELGPWCRADVNFMDTAGRMLRELADDVEGVDGFELDCEGSFEVTAKRDKLGIKHAVDASVQAFRQHMRPEESLSATVLYFRRPAGNYLLRSPVANIRRVVVQAYSVWLKKASTHTKAFQPGTLQDTAWSNYLRFKEEHDIDQLVMGLGWWAQDRRHAPAALRLSRAEGFRRASRACLELGSDGVSGWACHLFDGDSALEKSRRALVMNEIRYLTGQHDDADDDQVDGAAVDWSSAWVDTSVANGGRPAGYIPVKGQGLPFARLTDVASAVRRRALAGASRGWCVPFSIGDKNLVAVYQKHTATWVNGELKKGLDLNGVTVFLKG